MAAVLPANAQAIWQALIADGATPVQAAGIMGNMLHETINLDPELVALDTNGAYSRGLVMWNDAGAGSGVNWGQYITGNVGNDIRAQAGLIVAQGGLAKAAGADPYSAGVNFAHQFEACAECGYPGSAQLPLRGASAATVYQVAQSGNWSLGAGGLAPLGQFPASPDSPPPAAPVANLADLNPLQLGPGGFVGSEIAGLFTGFGGFVSGADRLYKSGTALFSALLAGSTWIRFGEVVLGVILGAGGLALVAVTLAASHPGAVADVASLIPGEGTAARVAVGAAGGVRRGVAGTAAGGVAGARRTSAAGRSARPRRRAPAAPQVAPAARTAARAATSAQGTARRATGQSGGLTPTQRAYRDAARRRERNRRLASQWGGPAPTEAQADEDDFAEARERTARRENRNFYNREVGTPRRRPRDTSDLRRRTG